MNAPAHVMLDDADLARADAYAVLARLLFSAPDAMLLSMLCQMRSAADGNAVTVEWNALCTAASDARRISDEYATLFVSVGRPQVELYASWYLTGFLMEKPLAQLRDDLLALGLARHDGQHDSEDHMAGELEVMRHLLLRGNDAQRVFFQRHLQPWYNKFCAALETAADARFYRAVARFMRVFLDMERDYFRLQAGDGGVT